MAKNKTQSVQKVVHDAKLKGADPVLALARKILVESLAMMKKGPSRGKISFYDAQRKQRPPRHRRGNAAFGNAW